MSCCSLTAFVLKEPCKWKLHLLFYFFFIFFMGVIRRAILRYRGATIHRISEKSVYFNQGSTQRAGVNLVFVVFTLWNLSASFFAFPHQVPQFLSSFLKKKIKKNNSIRRITFSFTTFQTISFHEGINRSWDDFFFFFVNLLALTGP